MSIFDKADPPPAPDYIGAANAQGQANVEAAKIGARLNNPNIVSPFGTQTVDWGTSGPQFNQSAYDQAMEAYRKALSGSAGGGGGMYLGMDPVTGQPNYAPARGGGASATPPNPADFYYTPPGGDQATVTQTLSPEIQGLLDKSIASQSGLAGLLDQGTQRVGASLEQPFDLSSLGSQEDYRKQIEDALYGRQMRLLDPQIDKEHRQLETDLVNRGFSLGNEGYTKQLDDFARRADEQRLQARNAAISSSSGEALQQRQQQIQEMLLQRQQPLSELSSLRTGAAPQLPQFQPYQPTAQPGATPVLAATNAQYGANLDSYNADVAQQNSLLSGLFQLGSGWALGGFKLPSFG